MITTISVLSFLCLLFLFVKYEWGIGLYLLLFFLVPLYYLYINGFIIGENLLSLILFLLLFFWTSNRWGVNKTSLFLVTPFLFLYLLQALLIPFHFSAMPLSEQLKIFRIDIMRMFLPFCILSIGGYDKRNVTLFTHVMYLVIAIATLYGVFLIFMPGQNPYIEAINPILEYEMVDQENILEEGLRVFGYISSVYPHVTEYGVFLIFSSVFLLYQFKYDKTIIPKILLGLVLVCVITCGSRSVLMGEAVVLFVYLYYHRQFKMILSAIIIVTIVGLLMHHFMPNYLLFLSSIGDESIAGGSSINMRYEQYKGCIEALKENPVFGFGYGWTGWYRSTFGRHPSMLSFESCIIQILCNNGILGLVIWGMMVVLVFKKITKYFHGNTEFKRIISLLLITYFSYTFYTGDYATFRVLMVFYALIVANEMSYQDANQKKIKIIQKFGKHKYVQ